MRVIAIILCAACKDPRVDQIEQRLDLAHRRINETQERILAIEKFEKELTDKLNTKQDRLNEVLVYAGLIEKDGKPVVNWWCSQDYCSHTKSGCEVPIQVDGKQCGPRATAYCRVRPSTASGAPAVDCFPTLEVCARDWSPDMCIGVR